MCSINDIGRPTLTTRLMVGNSSGVFHDVIEPESVLWRAPLLLIPLGVSEKKLFFILFCFYHIFSHLFAHKFGEVNIFFSVGEVGYFPFPFFLIPFWAVDDHINLVTGHKHIEDGWELFDLFLLVSDSIEKFFLLVLMLVLDISQFC